jgi:hypothetical protein
MIGNNELILNKATMVLAVQEYLDKRLIEGSRVTVTDVAMPNSGTAQDTFRVKVAKEDKPA